ncbi:MAG: hypothetical protein QXN68_02730 [Thermoplasmata archaeon]
MKQASEIIKWGKVKPFLDKEYNFNSIDIETIDNELFLFGYIKDDMYYYKLDNFFNTFHDLIIDSVQSKHDILTWSRYDNTHLLKMILKDIDHKEINRILLKIGKISPIHTYQYKNYTITIENIIKDSMIFKIDDNNGNRKRMCTIYNLKNLYHTNLETTAKNYKLDYYSKMGIEYHIIDKKRFNSDLEYKNNVILSNKLDNQVIIDIAYNMLENFKQITGVYPKTIFTNGSIARSYLLAYDGLKVSDMQFKTIFSKHSLFDILLDYSMKSYHGGKIESYALGYIKNAKIIDITTAYPYALSLLPKITDRVFKGKDVRILESFFYAFIRCDIKIDDINLIHPVIIKNPINTTNISPYGYLENVTITKIEYDYLLEKGCKIYVHDFVGVEHENIYPYVDLVNSLFNSRMKNRKTNISLAEMFKTIINSLYGITFELTDVYGEVLDTDDIKWVGYRAGDFFNPVLASYITAYTRTYLSRVSHNIIENGGEVYLNMTDSIIYDGKVTLDVFSDKKQIGKFDKPTIIKDVIILGAGRYEYKDDFNDTYTIKSRGFSVSIKDKAFYNSIDLNTNTEIEHTTFVTAFKATTNKYSFKQMGHLIPDTYKINPFNLGGKRIVLNPKVNLNKEYTLTKPVHIEKGIL